MHLVIYPVYYFEIFNTVLIFRYTFACIQLYVIIFLQL